MFIDTEKSPLAKKIPNKKQLNSPVVTGLVNVQLPGCERRSEFLPPPSAQPCFSQPTGSWEQTPNTQQSPAALRKLGTLRLSFEMAGTPCEADPWRVCGLTSFLSAPSCERGASLTRLVSRFNFY